MSTQYSSVARQSSRKSILTTRVLFTAAIACVVAATGIGQLGAQAATANGKGTVSAVRPAAAKAAPPNTRLELAFPTPTPPPPPAYNIWDAGAPITAGFATPQYQFSTPPTPPDPVMVAPGAVVDCSVSGTGSDHWKMSDNSASGTQDEELQSQVGSLTLSLRPSRRRERDGVRRWQKTCLAPPFRVK